jgi:hypothetical protein
LLHRETIWPSIERSLAHDASIVGLPFLITFAIGITTEIVSWTSPVVGFKYSPICLFTPVNRTSRWFRDADAEAAFIRFAAFSDSAGFIVKISDRRSAMTSGIDATRR